MVVLPDSFRGLRKRRNSAETQQSGHAPRYETDVKNEKNSAKDGAPEWIRCGTIQNEVNWILQMMYADVHRLIEGELDLADDVRRRPQVDRR